MADGICLSVILTSTEKTQEKNEHTNSLSVTKHQHHSCQPMSHVDIVEVTVVKTPDFELHVKSNTKAGMRICSERRSM